MSLASNTIRPAAGPSAAPSSISVSPFLPPPSAPSPPVCEEASPRVAAIRSSGAVDALLEAAPLAGAGLPRPPRAPRGPGRGRPARPPCASSSSSFASSFVSRVSWSSLRSLVQLRRLASIGPSGLRSSSAERRRMNSSSRCSSIRLIWAWTAPSRSSPKVDGDLLGELVAVRLEGLAEGARRPPRRPSARRRPSSIRSTASRFFVLDVSRCALVTLLELAPHVVDLDRRVLAVEDAGADLDRARRIVVAGSSPASARSRTTRAVCSSAIVRSSITIRSSTRRTEPGPSRARSAAVASRTLPWDLRT